MLVIWLPRWKCSSLQAVFHAARLQLLHSPQRFGHGQAELRAVAARRFPASRAAAGELDAQADRRPDADPLGMLEDQFELGVLLDDRNDVAADLLASITISMYSSSLKPLQMIGVSLSAMAITASSSGFEPASRPNR